MLSYAYLMVNKSARRGPSEGWVCWCRAHTKAQYCNKSIKIDQKSSHPKAKTKFYQVNQRPPLPQHLTIKLESSSFRSKYCKTCRWQVPYMTQASGQGQRFILIYNICSTHVYVGQHVSSKKCLSTTYLVNWHICKLCRDIKSIFQVSLRLMRVARQASACLASAPSAIEVWDHHHEVRLGHRIILVYNTWVHLKQLNQSFSTNCVANDSVCRSKDKVCR